MGGELRPDTSPEGIRVFTKALLRDVRALERMIGEGLIERGVRRFGAEQEFFLVDRTWRPAPVAMEVLKRLEGQPFTTELARFNLEANLEPLLLEGACFRSLEKRLGELVSTARSAARGEHADVVLCGILPTLAKADLSLGNITPRERYYALNDAMTRLRGGAYRLRIAGTDELMIEHDSVMLEACNTSCQVHLQVSAEEFASVYNVAQMVTPAVVAVAANSPLLFGRRLWAETRIALFHQSLDTRSGNLDMRELLPRVRFGERWVESSATELFNEDLTRFRVLLASEVEEDPLRVLDEGRIPELRALQLYNSTVYRWNRPCYGVSEGKPHLRIECRALPAGPTVVDEVANAAFWIGLVMGGAEAWSDVSSCVDFDDVRTNFLAASRLGLKAGFEWFEGESIGAAALIGERLLPLARRGLESAGVDADDVTRYLGVIEERVERGWTGAHWVTSSLASMKDEGTRAERLAALTASTVRQQTAGSPCHQWELARLKDAGGWHDNYLRLSQYMRTDLFTVHEDELVDLVAFVMDREQIRQVLVEDDEHRLVGLVSYRSVLRLVARGGRTEGEATAVREIMERHPVTASPNTPTLEAIELMRRHGVSCLPVVDEGKLVGLVSEHDFMPMAYELLRQRFTEEA